MILHQEHDYAVDVSGGTLEPPTRSGLSHAQAMARAEILQRAGKVVRVVHLVGRKSYEVDRYPPR
jgi:hypothetical protein